MAAPISRRFEPSGDTSQTCVSSICVSRSVTPRVVPRNAMRLPSGDQRGWNSALSVAVTRRMTRSATRTVKMSGL